VPSKQIPWPEQLVKHTPEQLTPYLSELQLAQFIVFLHYSTVFAV